MTLVNQVQDFVTDLMESKLSNLYIYHNLNHTTGVVNAVNILCDKENISLSDKEILLIAAWFHDTGYIKGYENHEDSSVKIAASFLKEKGKTQEFIAKISSLIKVTAKEYVPQTLLEKIIKDADYYHILHDDYVFECEGLRKEWEKVEGKEFSDIEWALENEFFLSEVHQFYTPYAIEDWQPLK